MVRLEKTEGGMGMDDTSPMRLERYKGEGGKPPTSKKPQVPASLQPTAAKASEVARGVPSAPAGKTPIVDSRLEITRATAASSATAPKVYAAAAYIVEPKRYMSDEEVDARREINDKYTRLYDVVKANVEKKVFASKNNEFRETLFDPYRGKKDFTKMDRDEVIKNIDRGIAIIYEAHRDFIPGDVATLIRELHKHIQILQKAPTMDFDAEMTRFVAPEKGAGKAGRPMIRAKRRGKQRGEPLAPPTTAVSGPKIESKADTAQRKPVETGKNRVQLAKEEFLSQFKALFSPESLRRDRHDGTASIEKYIEVHYPEGTLDKLKPKSDMTPSEAREALRVFKNGVGRETDEMTKLGKAIDNYELAIIIADKERKSLEKAYKEFVKFALGMADSGGIKGFEDRPPSKENALHVLKFVAESWQHNPKLPRVTQESVDDRIRIFAYRYGMSDKELEAIGFRPGPSTKLERIAARNRELLAERDAREAAEKARADASAAAKQAAKELADVRAKEFKAFFNNLADVSDPKHPLVSTKLKEIAKETPSVFNARRGLELLIEEFKKNGVTEAGLGEVKIGKILAFAKLFDISQKDLGDMGLKITSFKRTV